MTKQEIYNTLVKIEESLLTRKLYVDGSFYQIKDTTAVVTKLREQLADDPSVRIK